MKGGRGSAKSYEAVGKLPIIYLCVYPFRKFLIMRQRYNTHKGSTFDELISYIENWGLQSEFQISLSPIGITHKKSGNSILFKGMDKPAAIKSIKDITDIVWEECFEVKSFAGFDVVNKSVRTLEMEKFGGISKMIIPFNPDNKDHFLYEIFYDPSEEKARKYAYYRENAYYLTTTYRDNQFVSKDFIQLIEADRVANPERYLVDGLGEWGSIKETGLFYRFFDYASSVEFGLKKRVYDASAPLHITFDFNVYPYISLEVTQLNSNAKTAQLEVCTIDEICLTDKMAMGNLQKTVNEFLSRYKNHKGKVVVCGDRAGHSRKTNTVPDFATIFSMLQITPKAKYQKARDTTNRLIDINPYPEYEESGATFEAIDGTIHSQNPRLKHRQVFFERLHQGRLKVLPLSRNNGTINAAGQTRPLSAQYPNITIVQKIDEENCKFMIKDYQELKEDFLKGGKSTRNADLGHTSDAMDYQYCQIFDAELAFLVKELKL
jgi:PBSX family phage terminase large subunit